MLTGGHPNSLGRTIEVVETVLADEARMEELFGCYGSVDEVVRLARAMEIAGADVLNTGIGWHEVPVPTIAPAATCASATRLAGGRGRMAWAPA